MTATSLTLTELKSRIESRKARYRHYRNGLCWLPLALLFSEQRFAVTGFDIDRQKVNTLNAGGSYIVRISSADVEQAQKNGFRATADYSEIGQMDVVIICVPTPLNEYREPDLSYITGTLHAMAPHVRQNQLVILESTTYPGTTEEVVVPLLEKGNVLGLRVREMRNAGILCSLFA